MRQRVLCTILLVICCCAFVENAVANPVTRQQAQKNVKAFLEKKGKKIEPTIADTEPSKGEESESYYIFNMGSNNGFVIASGDDCVPAILGYSDKGFLDPESIPDNMKAWLQEYEDQIAYMNEYGLTSPEMLTSTHPAISPLLTTTWGQGDPYNQNCPIFFTEDRGRCVTGCVATAMAQVMYYHRQKSVQKTTAEIPSYQCSTNWTSGDVTLGHISVNAFPAESIIDWGNMLESYSGSSTAIQQQAVANLMAYCGASVNMNYANSWNGGSGAQSKDVPIALKRFFDYSEHTSLEERTNYSDEEWDALIYSELSKGNPIYYSGRNTSSGHAFVCDGYDGDGYYHFNWGWTGTSDGYFLLSALDPRDQGIGGSSSGYNLNQTALIGAVPNGEVVRLTTQNLTISGATTFSVSQGSSINLSVTVTLSNLTGSTRSFNNAIGLYSKGSLVDNNDIYELYDCDNASSESNYYQNRTLSIRTNLASGVYQLIPLSKEKGAEVWNMNGNSTEKYITLVVKDGTMSFYVGKPTVTTEVISFADNEVKRICVENWDTDGDGEISYEEAAAVTDFGTVFDGSSIKTFDEAQYFTGIQSFGLGWIGGCTNLTSIALPSSVKTIKNYAFYKCSALQTITLPSSVTSIGSSSFVNCSSLQSIILPEGLTAIGSYAFQNCSSLTSFSIPSSVITIGGNAFGGCTNLSDFEVAASNQNYCTIDGVLFTKDYKGLVQLPAKREGTYSIPDGTKTIMYGAFYGSLISGVSIPASVNKIEDFAFGYSKSITTIEIPNTVTNIGAYLFYYCDNIETVVLPRNITKIPDDIFSNCKKLKSIILPSNISSIGSWAFSNCKALTEIDIPSNVTSISGYAFYGCSKLKTVRSLTTTPCSIESTVFNGISSSAILYVPQGCKAAYKNADNWKIFSQILEIGGDQPYVVYNNGTLTFYNDTNRDTREGTTYDLNADQELPGWYSNRSSITNVVFDSSFSTALPITTYGWFSNCNNLTVIQGIEYLNTTKINNTGHMFFGCRNLSTIAIPNNLKSIDYKAFYNCTSLQEINLPNSLETIGSSAFLGCKTLSSVVIPASVTFIGENAFGGCTNLNDFEVNSGNSNYCAIGGVLYTKDGKTLIQYPAKREGAYAIPSNTETIEMGAFYGCNKLTETTIPQSVETIETDLFSGCSRLSHVTLPPNITSIGVSSFSNCTSLTEIEIPSKVESINSYAFYGCSQLATVKSLMQTPCSIAANVFKNISSEATLYVPKGCKSAYEAAENWSNFNIVESPTTYTLSIQATGNGSASYDGETIRDNTSSFTVIEGTNATITFSPDDGNIIRTVQVDGSAVSVSNNQYTVSNITNDTSVEVEFEEYNPLDGLSANNVTIAQGNKATLVISLDGAEAYTCATIDLQLPSGISIAKVLNEDDEMVPDVTSERTKSKHAIEVKLMDTTNNIYRIMTYASNNATFKTSGAMFIVGLEASASAASGTGIIIADGAANGTKVQGFVAPDGLYAPYKNAEFNIDVEEREIPTYNLSIKATGNGSVTYEETTIRGETNTFTVYENANATITFSPDNGYRVKAVNVNNSHVTICNNQYTVSSINQDTSVEVEFEEDGPDYLSANNVTIEAGKTATLEIGLNNTLEYTLATIDLMLPEGVTIVYNANEDEYAVELDRWNKKHTATVSEIAGGYRILIMDSSNKNKTIGAGEGTMATITLQASADAKSGTGQIIADGEANGNKTQIFITPDGTQYFLQDVEFNITVSGSDQPDTQKMLYAEDVTAFRGTQVTIPIQLDNEQTVSGFQFDLELPDGIEFVKAEATDRMSDFSLTRNNVNGKIRFVAYTMEDEIVAGSGELMSLTIDIPSDYVAGNYDVNLSGIKLTHTENGLPIVAIQNDVVSTLQVFDYKYGDADGDNLVDVADVVVIVNYILEKNPPKFVFAAADVIKDNTIDVADVVGTVNIILERYIPSYSRAFADNTNNNKDQLLLKCNDDMSMSLCLNNQNQYVAAQFDVKLTDGQSIERLTLNSSRAYDHRLKYGEIGPNLYRVMIYSLDVSDFMGHEGELVNIRLNNGEGNVRIENIKFITSDYTIKKFAPLYNNTTGIKEMVNFPAADIYSVDGRLVRKQVTSTEGLKDGIYIINKQKVIIKR